MGRKMRISVAAAAAVLLLAVSAVGLAAPEAEDCGAGCKLKAAAQSVKCSLQYSVDVVKCKQDETCKAGCKQAREACKAEAGK